MLMSSNCSTSSMINFCLLILITIAACPAFLLANLNLRRAALSSCGMSTVRDYVVWSGSRESRGISRVIATECSGQGWEDMEERNQP